MARFLSPFDRIQAIFSGSCSLVAVAAARLLRVRSLVHIAGGELVALPGIDYGGRPLRVSRLREALVMRTADDVSAASAPITDSLEKRGISAHRAPRGVSLRARPPRLPPLRGARRA